MSSDATDTPPPSLIGGKYELHGLIGRGGMGSVYEGRHASLGTPVAIKFIDAEYANSSDAKSRFDTEARAAATIQSKHAIQIFDHGVTQDGRPYIVMELLVGEPLDKRITRLGALSLAETARVIRQVARALSRAHDRGIVHRDLKPENIFLVRGPDDDEDIAKVLDFGIAKIKAAPGAVGISSSTKTGTLLGTPFFMSPEQARGLRTVDHRSDLWSLGVIVFKSVTGVLPFDGESLGDLLVKICTAPIPIPSHVIPDLPLPLDAWMSRALDREPETRFQSAMELADSLGAIAGLSFPRSSTPEPGGYVNSSPYSPRPVSSQAGRNLPGVLGGATERVPFSGPEYAQPLSAATSAPITASAPQPARRSSKLGYVGGALLGLLAGFAGVFYLVTGSKTQSAQGIAVGTPAPPVMATTASAPLPTPPTVSGETTAVAPLLPLEPSPSAAAATHVKPSGAKQSPTKAKQSAVPSVAGTPLPPTGPAVAPPQSPPSPPPKPTPNLGEPGY
jgi:serine/threonine-protein kinase